jgi:hypothetical protein
MIRAASIVRAKEQEGATASVLWKNTKLPDKREFEGDFEVMLLLHG